MTENLAGNPHPQFQVLSALHEIDVLREVNVYQLNALASRGIVASFEAGEEVAPPDPGDRREPHSLLVVSGDVSLLHGKADGSGKTQQFLRTGELYGELSVVTGQPIDCHARALGPSTVLFLMKRDLDELYETSAAFRRAVLRGLEDLVEQQGLVLPWGQAVPFPGARAERVIVQEGDGGIDLECDAFADLLASAVARGFGSRVLALRVAAHRGESVEAETDGTLTRLTVEPGRMLEAIEAHEHDYEYIFVLAGPPGSPASREVPELVPSLSRVRVWEEFPSAEQTTGVVWPQVVETVLLPPAPEGARWRPRWKRDKDLAEGRSLEWGTPRLESRLRLPPSLVRRAWRRGGHRALAPLAREYADELARWARCLTGRSVGLALGGGGAWGYAHVALIRALHQRGVPIDLVTGASFGSVVGAYYAVDGLEGLDRLVERGMWMERTSLVSTVSTRLLEEFIAWDLGEVKLEETSILFHPYSTNLSSGRGAALTRGRVALGVRASSSAPGVYGPTIVPGVGHYVDGCVVNNVPTVVLYARSAALRIAANIYPPPPARQMKKEGLWARLRQVNPLGRVLDASASGSLMLHVAGVRQSATASVLFDVHNAMGARPLLQASAFRDAEKIVTWAEQDPSIQRSADEAARLWRGML